MTAKLLSAVRFTRSNAANSAPCSAVLTPSAWVWNEFWTTAGTENGLVDSVAGSTAEQPRLPHANALKNHYETLVQSQALKPDAQQRACVAQLNTLCNQLMAYSQRVDDFEEQSEKYQVSCQTSCLFSGKIWKHTHSYCHQWSYNHFMGLQ